VFEYFKEVVSAANSRVRSPVLGSIAVVFTALNWKELFYVFFAETSVQVRLSYFDVNTDNWSLIYWPLIVGGILSFLYPWITLASSQLAKFPVRALKTMQGEEDIIRQIKSLENEANIEKAKAELEEATAEREKENEDRVLAAASRLIEAQELGSNTVSEIETARKESVSASEVLQFLGENKLALQLLRAATQGSDGQLELRELNVSYTHPSKGRIIAFTLDDHRQFLEASSLLSKLNEFGLMTQNSTNIYIITHKGYEYIDKYKAG
jgi:hypothetical protein